MRNPNGINPVSANDVFFSLHAVLLCLVYTCQAAVYEVCVCREACDRVDVNNISRSSIHRVKLFQISNQMFTVYGAKDCIFIFYICTLPTCTTTAAQQFPQG